MTIPENGKGDPIALTPSGGSTNFPNGMLVILGHLGAKPRISIRRRIEWRGSRRREGGFSGLSSMLSKQDTPFTQTTLRATYQQEDFSLVRTNPTVKERPCPKSANGIEGVLLGVLFYICIANMSTRPVSLPKHIIVELMTHRLTPHVRCTHTKRRAWRKRRGHNL